ncbi:hypothetical protein VNI00_005007 [Paramarasmius palmivorus]|uniref:Uncharacterized protein n=1 Tax=Paramarasmius palmivorus TaxID=297713 RepID=A0AAW0DH19_9AGAR
MSSLLRTARVAARPLAAPRAVAARRLQSTAPPKDIPIDPEPLTEYPDVPPVNRQYLPPLGWQDVQLRRNFGDPLHEQDELYSMWSPDVPPVDPSVALRHFALAALTFTGVFFFIKNYGTPEPHFVRRTYPYGGLVKELGGLEENKARVDEETEE